MRRLLTAIGLLIPLLGAVLMLATADSSQAAAVVSCQGIVQSWDPFRSAVSIAASTGLFARTSVDAVIVPSSRITREGLPAEFVNIRVGDTARSTLRYTSGRYEVLEIDVVTTNGRRIPSARLLAMDLPKLNRPSFLRFESVKGSILVRASAVYDSRTLFWKEGGPCRPVDITPSDLLSLVVAPQGDGTLLATRVEAAIPPEAKPYTVSGVVVGVRAGLVRVRAANGVEVDVEISADAYVRRDKTRINPAGVEQAIQRGDRITAAGGVSVSYNLLAVSVAAASPEHSARGVVLENRFTDSVMVVGTDAGPVEVLVTEGASIQISGFPADLCDVRPGALVDVKATDAPGARWLLTSLDVVK